MRNTELLAFAGCVINLLIFMNRCSRESLDIIVLVLSVDQYFELI
jgi:hypothetical protein